MHLTQYERETVICYNEAEKTASVYTHNPALRRKLDKLTAERPEDCQMVSTCHGGQAADYTVPKDWIKVKPPRPTSEAQRAASRESIRRLLSSQRTRENDGFPDHISPAEGSYTPDTHAPQNPSTST